MLQIQIIPLIQFQQYQETQGLILYCYAVDLVDEKLPPPLPEKDKLKFGRIEKVYIHPSSCSPKEDIKYPIRQMDDIASNGSQTNETNILVNDAASWNKNEGNTVQGTISLPDIRKAIMKK